MKMSDVLTHDEINHRGWLELALTGNNSDNALNAAYISVRNHDKLVEALEAALNYIHECPCDPDIYPEQLEAWNKLQDIKAKEALKQAKGGE